MQIHITFSDEIERPDYVMPSRLLNCAFSMIHIFIVDKWLLKHFIHTFHNVNKLGNLRIK